jgi:hypothetical protein
MWGWFVLAVAAVAGSVAYLIRVRKETRCAARAHVRAADPATGARLSARAQHLSSSSVPLSVKVDVCLGWAVALFVVALVPLDVVVVRCGARRPQLSQRPCCTLPALTACRHTRPCTLRASRRR